MACIQGIAGKTKAFPVTIGVHITIHLLFVIYFSLEINELISRDQNGTPRCIFLFANDVVLVDT